MCVSNSLVDIAWSWVCLARQCLDQQLVICSADATTNMGITFDEALASVGSFGRWQRRVVIVSSSFYIPNAFALLLLIFACTDPISNHSWSCVDPEDTICSAVWLSTTPKDGFCALPTASWVWTKTDSLVARFHLICADAWKVQLLNSFMFAGAFVGSGLFGWMSDKYGRKLPLFAATAITSALLFATTAAPNYAFLAVMRALTGCAAAGQNQLFLVCTEVTGSEHRGTAGIATTIVFTIGEFLLCVMAYVLPNWRHLMLAAAAVNAAALLLYPLVPESPRWLLSQGRQHEAACILRNISASNGSSMPTEPLICSRSEHSSSDILEQGKSDASTKRINVHCSTDSSSDTASEASSTDHQGHHVSILQMLKVPTLAVMCLVLVVAWFGQFLGYYGIAMGSGTLPGSIYVSFTLGTTAELAALLVAGVLVDRVGRHNLVSVSMLLGGAACLACANSTGQTETAVLAAIGKFGISAALAACPIFSTELFPTVVRGTAMGLLNQVGRCGSIAAPFLLMMGAQLGLHSAVFLPFLVFGVVAVLAGVLVLFLPETLGMAMPETLKDLSDLPTIVRVKPWRSGLWATIKFLFALRAMTPEELGNATSPAICSGHMGKHTGAGALDNQDLNYDRDANMHQLGGKPTKGMSSSSATPDVRALDEITCGMPADSVQPARYTVVITVPKQEGGADTGESGGSMLAEIIVPDTQRQPSGGVR